MVVDFFKFLVGNSTYFQGYDGKFWATEHDHHEFGVEGLQQLHPVGPKQITPQKKNDVEIYVGMYKTVDTDMICMCKYNIIYIYVYVCMLGPPKSPSFVKQQ